MAKGVVVWSTTAGSNATIDSLQNWAENMAPSQVNDSARGGMESVARWRDDLNGTLLANGGPTAYTLTMNQAPAALSAGLEVAFKMSATNTGAVTLNVTDNGGANFGAKPLRSAAGVELVAGALPVGGVFRAVYASSNGGEWLLQNANPTIIASSQVVTASIADGAVTLAKHANVSATARAIGRNTAGAGVPEEVTVQQILNWISASSRGDVLVRGAADWDRLAKGTPGQVLRSDGTDTSWGPYGQLFHVREEQASGTNSQTTPTTGATWNKRLLNVTKTNEIASASLSSSVISLPAGTYEVDGQVVLPLSANGGNSNARARVRDTSNSVTLVVGTNNYTSTVATGGTGESHLASIKGRFTLAGTANLEIQGWSNTAGVATASTTGEVECYTDVLIRRVA